MGPCGSLTQRPLSVSGSMLWRGTRLRGVGAAVGHVPARRDHCCSWLATSPHADADYCWNEQVCRLSSVHWDGDIDLDHGAAVRVIKCHCFAVHEGGQGFHDGQT